MSIIFMVIAVLFSSASFAAWSPADEDLENCYWRDGHKMSEKNCTEFRTEVANERDVQKRNAEYLEQSRIEQARDAAEKAKRQTAAEAEAHKKQQAETERLNEVSKRWFEAAEREEWAEREAAKAARTRELEVKEKCGADYKSPQIGMTLSRAQQCVGKFKLKSQLNRVDGVISTYVNGYTYINVMNDRIISWQKF